MSYDTDREDTNCLGDLLRQALDGHETVWDLTEKDGVRRVEVIRRKALPEVRKDPLPLDRTPARSHVFHEIEAFAKYVSREQASDSCVILADAEREQIVAVLDEKVGEGVECVSFKPTIHPLFKPWFDRIDKPIPVLEFGLFCAKYRRSIAKPDGREVALIFQQIKIAKTIEINKGVGAKALNGIMIQTDIAGSKGSQLVEIPETIEIHCPIYIGTEPVRIPLDILIHSRGEAVDVYVTCPELAVLRSDAFVGFVDQLKDCENLLVGLGAITHRPWETVKQG